MGLMPYRLGDLGRLARTAEFKLWEGMSCMECGCCSFVCPSKRPLVEWIRVGKIKLRESERGEAA
jgi:electron transport complex protein RnfC